MVLIREFEPKDAEAVSYVIRQTMKTSNHEDYSPEILQPLIDYFSPEKILQLNRERFCLVAEADNKIVGTAAIEEAELLTFFVLPEYQKRGIGRKLLEEIENFAKRGGIKTIHVDSSVTGQNFYENSGYRKTGVEKTATAGRQIEMVKNLK